MILIERNDIMKLTKKYETLVRNYLSELYSTYMLRNDISFIKGGLVALLEYKLPKKQFKKVLNILDDNFTSNWLPYFFDKEEFITTFIDFVFLGGNWIEVYRNNDSCESFRDRPTNIVSRKEMNDIANNYFQHYHSIFNEAFNTMDNAFMSDDINGFIKGVNTITYSLGKDVQYNTMEEFDEFMESNKNFIL